MQWLVTSLLAWVCMYSLPLLKKAIHAGPCLLAPYPSLCRWSGQKMQCSCEYKPQLNCNILSEISWFFGCVFNQKAHTHTSWLQTNSVIYLWYRPACRIQYRDYTIPNTPIPSNASNWYIYNRQMKENRTSNHCNWKFFLLTLYQSTKVMHQWYLLSHQLIELMQNSWHISVGVKVKCFANMRYT